MKKAIILLAVFNTATFAQQKGSFTDPRDKKSYKTVKIGTQTWMAENLNYAAKGSKCGGTKKQTYINEEREESIGIILTGGNTVNCDKYGRLYNFEAAIKACPNDWHLPSDEEWETLVDFVGGNNIAETKLKAKSGWNNYEGKSDNGDDVYGFSALPGGFGPYADDGIFESVGSFGIWWGYYRDDDVHSYNYTIGGSSTYAIAFPLFIYTYKFLYCSSSIRSDIYEATFT